MGFRDGPPPPRDPPNERSARVNVVGAPPVSVSWGLPGARDEVRAYVARVDAAADLMQGRFADWTAEKKGGGVALTDDEIKYLADWPSFYARWKAWTVQLDSFDPTGPSPSEAWQKTEVFEKELESLRVRFAALTTATTTKAPPPPGPLEDPGGIKQPGPLEALTGVDANAIPWTGILIVGGIIGGGLVLASVMKAAT